MSIERIAVNASPLITLYRANLHPLLPQIFPEILVPDAVWDEVVSRTHEGRQRGQRKTTGSDSINI